ncbi:hypothetical protein T440DRAFT_12884 [Plenodomus tracheiphilus IPT5]|uniref:Uncharacterized protein n=1 Tax=Plenodomus tracheiphilus IPT5 TaxID=1408161 RepID=A0A6A7BN68_9PLEO|nr:hypothetical protein T440DRAFT_12884 [Plenodomus tracheiphilus IPT5]
MSWCCSRGRLFLVWVMLCGLDQVYCDRQRREASTSGQNGRVSAGSGVGYTSGHVAYSQLYQNRFGRPKNSPLPDGKREQAESTERQIDHFDSAIFSSLAVLCPSPHRDRDIRSFDVYPPRAVVSMLVHSKILKRAAELLRNDSLDNATQRKSLYMALISFLKRVGVHEVSKNNVIFSERIDLPLNNNLLNLSIKGPPPQTMETASSLADGLRRLNVQSDTMMRGAINNRNEFQDQRGQDMLWLCREISDLSTHLKIKEWTAKQGSDTIARSSAVTEVPDSDLWPRYHFVRAAQALQHSPLGRIRSLITEITTLKTGLPDGIFVKHAMSRLDCMT